MKKLSFASQLFILFAGILLITSVAFSIITITSVNAIASDEVYSRLSSYSMLFDTLEFKGDRRKALNEDFDMRFGYIIKNNGEIRVSSNFEFEITNDDVNKLISIVMDNKEASFGPRVQGNETVNSKELYYVCQSSEDFSSFIIVFTDTAYRDTLVRSLSVRSIIVFLSMILVSILVISLWSNRYVKRIKKLQYHIESMPDNKYEKSYIDVHEDEVGQLSLSVERMRIELSSNEKTKQEMLQNLSHDFKTPISVIKSYAEAIEDGVESLDSLNIIIEQADLLKSKVTKLLQYNSIEYLDRSVPFTDIDMEALINDVVIKYKHHSNINFVIDTQKVCFKGYKENWDIVLSNIIENALRYAKNEIKIILRPDRLRIYNDGEHIDEKFINNVFKPYEKGSKGQFGLGMSIVQKTVNFFGYVLSVRNEEEIGVSFIIETPDRSRNI